MTPLEKLKDCENLRDLAILLKVQPKDLARILYGIKEERKYHSFTIPKKNGEEREITAPISFLKTIQKKIQELLDECLININKKHQQSLISHGFVKERSILTNATIHKKKKILLNLDLEDFFGSINFGRVRGFFIKNRHFKLDPTVATVLAKAICFDNKLPQGSPCSPIVSNLLMHSLDLRLLKLARKSKCRYSRYADDITFSSNLSEFPDNLIKDGKIGYELEEEITRAGFLINTTKTRVQFNRSRQEVTGLITNTKLSAPLEFRKNTRSMAHSLFTYGRFYTGIDPTTQEEINGTLNQLNGRLSYLYQIDKFNDELNKSNPSYTINQSRRNTYRKFLFYKYFYNNDKPIVVCEGKTDSIYLSCAIKSLHKNLSKKLVKINNNEPEVQVEFYKYSRVNSDLLNIGGGTGDLHSFFTRYLDNFKKYKLKKLSEKPVIVVFDNDDSGRHSASVIVNQYKKKGHKVKRDAINGAYHVIENLYVLVLPKINNLDTDIEDFFDKHTLNIKVGNKRFSKDPNSNSDIFFSKSVFAEKVVKQNRKKINFSGFQPILDSIEKLI